MTERLVSCWASRLCLCISTLSLAERQHAHERDARRTDASVYSFMGKSAVAGRIVVDPRKNGAGGTNALAPLHPPDSREPSAPRPKAETPCRGRMPART